MYKRFLYGLENTVLSCENDLVVNIPTGISSKKQLLDFLYEKLNLPGYFGFNWDALDECLRDFSWVESKRIILVHEDIPPMDSSELAIYLDVLSYCIEDWFTDDNHELVVVFPKSAEDTVRRLQSS